MPNEFKKRYWITKKQAADLTKLASAMYSESHPELEINNPKPLFEALGIKKPLSMEQKLDRLFKGPDGIIQQMYEQGEETPEDFNDFEMYDDIDPVSPYEINDMEPDSPSFSPKPPSSEPQSSDPSPSGDGEGDRPEGDTEPSSDG